MQQIPEEGRLFQTVDRNWREIMGHCVKDSKVKETQNSFANVKNKIKPMETNPSVFVLLVSCHDCLLLTGFASNLTSWFTGKTARLQCPS